MVSRRLLGKQMNLIKLRLLGDGRRGNQQIVKFFSVSLNNAITGIWAGNCSIRNDVELQQKDSDLSNQVEKTGKPHLFGALRSYRPI